MNLNTGAALSAYEIWTAVCGKCEVATRANRTALRRHLQQLRYRDGDDMEKCLNCFRRAASVLSTIGATMSDDNLTDMLLCSLSLSKSFDTMIQTTQESNNKASFTITNRLTAEVRRQKLRLSEDHQLRHRQSLRSTVDRMAMQQLRARATEGHRETDHAATIAVVWVMRQIDAG